MKLSHGEVKSIINPIQIRASKFEIAAPGTFGRTPLKSDFAKMSISEISPNKQNSFKILKFRSKLQQNCLKSPEFRFKTYAKILRTKLRVIFRVVDGHTSAIEASSLGNERVCVVPGNAAQVPHLSGLVPHRSLHRSRRGQPVPGVNRAGGVGSSSQYLVPAKVCENKNCLSEFGWKMVDFGCDCYDFL